MPFMTMVRWLLARLNAWATTPPPAPRPRRCPPRAAITIYGEDGVSGLVYKDEVA